MLTQTWRQVRRATSCKVVRAFSNRVAHRKHGGRIVSSANNDDDRVAKRRSTRIPASLRNQRRILVLDSPDQITAAFKGP